MLRKIFFCLIIAQSAFAQHCVELDNEANIRIKSDITFLASDHLEGRFPGTRGATIAANYIVSQFKQLGLTPMVDGSFLDEFSMYLHMAGDTNKNGIEIRGDQFLFSKDIYPVKWGHNGKASGKMVYVGFGIEAPELAYNNYEDQDPEKLDKAIFLMDISSPDGIHPHSKYIAHHDLRQRLLNAKKHGAAGVILYQKGNDAIAPQRHFSHLEDIGIPVMFCKDEKAIDRFKKKKEATVFCQLTETEIKTSNVAGFLNNNARFTVVIGAHYDHLGYGQFEGSLHVGKPAIHNGADDNASGVAALLEIARQLTSYHKNPAFNYVFVAFSGEEEGLLGSSHFVQKGLVDLSRVSYMINLDMVGRLNEEGKLFLSGTGSAQEWEKILHGLNCGQLNIEKDPSGDGPSDHMSFNQQGIPVLHFFTGSHSDYHKPSDDVERINFKGIGRIIGYLLTIVNGSNEFQHLTYVKTKSKENKETPRFNVTLGILPDYAFEGPGVKVQGVTDGKPASKAGILANDIVIKMGGIPISDIYGYMGALGSFRPGQTADVIVNRDGKEVSLKVTF